MECAMVKMNHQGQQIHMLIEKKSQWQGNFDHVFKKKNQRTCFHVFTCLHKNTLGLNEGCLLKYIQTVIRKALQEL